MNQQATAGCRHPKRNTIGCRELGRATLLPQAKNHVFSAAYLNNVNVFNRIKRLYIKTKNLTTKSPQLGALV